MNPMTAPQQVSLGLILAVLMAVTRGQHVALATHLPDASLAVFFLAGVYLRPVWVFPALFGLAALIDTAAVTWGGVGAFCITGAYAALIPAYGALWAAGRWYAGRHRQAWSSLIPLTGAVLLGALVSEVCSTGGFYLFSGVFPAPTLEGLALGVAKYLPASLGSLGLYLGLAALTHVVVSLVQPARAGIAHR